MDNDDEPLTDAELATVESRLAMGSPPVATCRRLIATIRELKAREDPNEAPLTQP